MIQFGHPVSISKAWIESLIWLIKDDKVFFVYSMLPARCRWSSTHFFNDTSRLLVKRDWRRMPRSSKSSGFNLRAWIRGNENFPSSRSSQNPFCTVYYTQIRQYTRNWNPRINNILLQSSFCNRPGSENTLLNIQTRSRAMIECYNILAIVLLWDCMETYLVCCDWLFCIINLTINRNNPPVSVKTLAA